jgi:hypothetical protein
MTELANLALALALCAASLGIGMMVVARVDRAGTCDGATRLATGLLVGFLIVHFAIWAVGSLRYDAATMAGLGIVLAVAGSLGLRRIDRAEIGRWWRDAVAWARGDLRAAAGLVVLAALVLAGILAGLAPPSDFDGLNYHLALAKFDLERGYIKPWDLNFLGFFPALAETIARLPLALTGPEAAQVVTGVTAAATAALLAGLARAGGAGRGTALLAAILFLSLRIVAWESGTTYVDITLAGYTLAAFGVLEAWRRAPGLGPAVLFGLLMAGAVNTKYHGLAIGIAFAPGVLWGLRRGIAAGQIATAVGVALAGIAPFALRNALVAGDPLYPLFGMTEYIGTIGRGDGLGALLRAPWDISIYAARYFDGHVLGTPYLLAFLPWAFLARGACRALALRALAPAGIYFVLWFFLLSQQVRFLLPVAPLLCLAAAVGAVETWRLVRPSPLARAGFVALVALLALGQSAYLGATVLIRAPVILGLMDETAYFTRVPTIQGSNYVPCRYITERLKPGETYLMAVTLRSYYCPQAAIVALDPDAAPQAIVRAMAEKRVRYLFVQTAQERRNTPDGTTIRGAVETPTLLGPAIVRALGRVAPVFHDEFTAIYDAKDVAHALE